MKKVKISKANSRCVMLYRDVFRRGKGCWGLSIIHLQKHSCTIIHVVPLSPTENHCPSPELMGPTPCEDQCSTDEDCVPGVLCCPGGCQKHAKSDTGQTQYYSVCFYPGKTCLITSDQKYIDITVLYLLVHVVKTKIPQQWRNCIIRFLLFVIYVCRTLFIYLYAQQQTFWHLLFIFAELCSSIPMHNNGASGICCLCLPNFAHTSLCTTVELLLFLVYVCRTLFTQFILQVFDFLQVGTQVCSSSTKFQNKK